MTTDRADAIVVGAGSAGAAVTRRLIDAGLSVILLEAGGPDTSEAIHDPGRAHDLWLSEQDWAYYTSPQPGAAGRRLHWPRGKVIGGSGALNGMIWVRGMAADFDHWAYLGNAGWRWSDVLPVFLRAEHYDHGEPPSRGHDGPMHILTDWEPAPVHAAIVAASGEVGIPFDPDYNDGDPDGISYMQLMISGGRRHSSAIGYLRPVLDHPALTVVTRAHAQRLLFDGNRCTGVEYAREGAMHRAHAGETILSGGTLESPRLLMLSGIGPADQLRTLGIGVLVDLPGVGENLHDHIISPVIFSAERTIDPTAPGLPQNQTHLFARSRPDLAVPDLQPVNFDVALTEPGVEPIANGFSLLAGMIRPASRGALRLTSDDPTAEMEIDPGTLTAEADLERLVAAVRLCRRIGEAPALAEWGADEVYPGHMLQTDAELAEYVRQTVITYHHQVGTCKMGIDAMAVVDPELRVYGTEGLRVADASIMPDVTTGNTNAPAVMIGERAADFVTGGRAVLASATSQASPPAISST